MARKSRKTQGNSTPFVSTVFNSAVYIRLSVEDNKKRGNSIESQKSIIENYIALNPDFEVYKTYIDNGATGVNFERNGFKRMLDDIESGKVNCVIVKDLSRLGRNVIDTGYYIEKYFPLKNVRFIAVNDNFDSDDKANVHNGIILPLKNMINEAYSLDIAKKIRAQAEQSIKAGDYIGARPPYGYLKSPENCHKLIIDPETAPIVRQIFRWAYEKVSLNSIVLRLNEADILPPSQHKQSVGLITNEKLLGNGKWLTITVSRILADQVYVGDMVQGKSKTFNRKQIRANEEDWITVSNTHEPIISREVFEAVKEYRKQIAEDSKKIKAKPYSENIFKGKIFCGHCGKNLHRERNKTDKYYFHCITNSRVKKGDCKGTHINEPELISAVTSMLRKKSEVLIGRDFMSAQSNKALNDGENAVKSKISSLNKGISQNRTYLKGLYENLVNQLISETDYFDFKRRYEEKIESALNEIRGLENKQKEQAEKDVQNRGMIGEVRKLNRKKSVLTFEIVDRLIEKIIVDSDKNIVITFKFESSYENNEVYGL